MQRSFTRRAVATVIAVLVSVPFVEVGAASAMDTGSNKDSVENFLGINSTGLNRLQRRQEESIAQCMKKEGFEYYPESSPIPADALDGGTSNRKAFVDKYGYGISTLINPPAKGTKSKNQAYVDKLSKADKHAYYIALAGFDPAAPSGDPNTAGLNPKTCVGKMAASLFGDIAKIQALFSKFEELEKRVNANTKVVKAQREWSACMKKSGYTYAKDTDVQEDLNGRMAKLFKNQSGSLLGGADLSSIDVPGLTALKKQELATAKADWDCSKKHLGVRDEISADLQKKFIADNQAALAAFKKVLEGK